MVHGAQSESDSGRSIVLEQGDDCFELVPLSGEETVEAFYDYRYPTNSFDSIAGSTGDTFSSHGTTDLQEDYTSVLFLYDGPDGLSLIVVHGHLDGDDDGGVVSFTLEGMPEEAEWIVKDDLYLDPEDGEPWPTNYDRWADEGTTHQIDWAYRYGRTDGGVAYGLGEEFEITIDPAFNEDAALAPDHGEKGPIEEWEAVSSDGDSHERFSLDMDEPVTIRTGSCEESTDTPEDEPVDDPTDEPTDTPDNEPVDDPTDTPEDQPVDDPTDTPDDEPTDEPVDGPTDGDGAEGC